MYTDFEKMIKNDSEKKILKLFGFDFQFFGLDISLGSKYVKGKEI